MIVIIGENYRFHNSTFNDIVNNAPVKIIEIIDGKYWFTTKEGRDFYTTVPEQFKPLTKLEKALR